MNRVIPPGSRRGSVTAPSSKSEAHRALICAALSQSPCRIVCASQNADIEATAACLRALGATVGKTADGFSVCPAGHLRGETALCPCGESGSTLRFLIPVAGALGKAADFLMEGRLPQRPMTPFLTLLSEHGMSFETHGNVLSCRGKLRGGEFPISGKISSQYVSGLLLALPLLAEDSVIRITDELESAAYVKMTAAAQTACAVEITETPRAFSVRGGQRYLAPPVWNIGGDYSGAAFFLCAGAFSAQGITVTGLPEQTAQGDRKIEDILAAYGAQVTRRGDTVSVRAGERRALSVDASGIPDLVPVIAVLGAVADGVTVIDHARRLRLKESDRLQSTAQLIRSLGGTVTESEDALTIVGQPMLTGGTANSFSDHRIAMAAAVAALVCRDAVTVTDAACTGKSYPAFFDDFDSLEAE